MQQFQPWSIIAGAAVGGFRVASFTNRIDAVDRLRFLQKALPSQPLWLEFSHSGCVPPPFIRRD